MFKPQLIKKLLSLSILLLFISCGSSTTSTDDSKGQEDNVENTQNERTSEETTTNKAPTANAGEDVQVNFGTTVVLDATKSTDDKGITDYAWSLNSKVISHEKSLVLDNLAEGSYIYTLTVTDEENLTDTDTIEIRTYTDDVVKLETTQGTILLKMMSNIAPLAVENFTTHSKNGYYDGVIFHRVIKDFMIQGGDPTGTGRGGESIWGEPFSNEIDPNVRFDQPFLLAMANTGKPKSNGSQFFITTKEYPFLDGKYTIFGTVVDGKEVVTSIENVATGRADRPNSDQTITKATIYFKKK